MKRPPSDTAQLRAVLGLNIRIYRTRRELTQRQLAQMAGTSPNRIGAIEKGETSTTVDVIERLAIVLKVEPWKLLVPDEQ